MPRKFLLTAFSKDRPGIVADISQVIYENSCNLEESAMANLAGEFALILMFSPLSQGNIEKLETDLAMECRRLEREKGITAFIRIVDQQEPQPQDVYSKTLHVEGLDQAGIIFKVSRFLADNNININSLNSEVKSSPESGAALYSMTMEIAIPRRLTLATVENGLSRIGDQLQVDITMA